MRYVHVLELAGERAQLRRLSEVVCQQCLSSQVVDVHNHHRWNKETRDITTTETEEPEVLPQLEGRTEKRGRQHSWNRAAGSHHRYNGRTRDLTIAEDGERVSSK